MLKDLSQTTNYFESRSQINSRRSIMKLIKGEDQKRQTDKQIEDAFK